MYIVIYLHDYPLSQYFTIIVNNNMNITAIGEILFDIYPSFRKMGGAPFNFIYHINRLSGKGNFISRIGNDVLGYEILSFLKAKRISTEYIQLDNIHPTGTACVSLNDKGIPEFIISEETAYDFIDYTDEIRKLEQLQPHILYSGTLAQRIYSSFPSTYHTVTSLLKKDFIYMLDINLRQNYYNKEILLNLLQRANILKVNLDELIIIESLSNGNIFNINTTPHKLKEMFDIDLLCITMGENGSILFKDGKTHHYKPGTIYTTDTVGAGDAFAAALCIGYMNNLDIEKINITSSNFAAEICKIHGAIPESDDLYLQYRDLLNT